MFRDKWDCWNRIEKYHKNRQTHENIRNPLSNKDNRKIKERWYTLFNKLPENMEMRKFIGSKAYWIWREETHQDKN